MWKNVRHDLCRVSGSLHCYNCWWTTVSWSQSVIRVMSAHRRGPLYSCVSHHCTECFCEVAWTGHTIQYNTIDLKQRGSSMQKSHNANQQCGICPATPTAHNIRVSLQGTTTMWIESILSSRCENRSSPTDCNLIADVTKELPVLHSLCFVLRWIVCKKVFSILLWNNSKTSTSNLSSPVMQFVCNFNAAAESSLIFNA